MGTSSVVIVKRLTEILNDKENYVPSIKDIAIELNVNPRTLLTSYRYITGKIILKRREQSAKNRDISKHTELYKSVNRACLNCDTQFSARNKYLRICDACKRKEEYNY